MHVKNFIIKSKQEKNTQKSQSLLWKVLKAELSPLNIKIFFQKNPVNVTYRVFSFVHLNWEKRKKTTNTRIVSHSFFGYKHCVSLT